MTASVEIKLGKRYLFRSDKKDIPVRIESKHASGGWIARSLISSKMIHVRDTANILRECSADDLVSCSRASNQRTRKKNVGTSADACQTNSSSETRYPGTSQQASSKTKHSEKKVKTTESMKVLAAAYRVLLESGVGMTTGDIAELAIHKGYWVTDGKTPPATVHAALSRDIKAYGPKSRFIKKGRGQFAAR